MKSIHEPTDTADPGTANFPTPRGWGYIVAVALLVIAGLSWPGSRLGEQCRLMQAANNGRQILISLASYARDHDGQYPDGATANAAFRQLFTTELLDDERAFTAYYSPYAPDNDMGEAPLFAKTLRAGENHWAMTKGLTSRSEKSAPLIFENPALPSWPPYWNAEAVDVKEPGRVWKNQRIIAGRVDGSILAEHLGPKTGPHATLAPIQGGKNLFDLAGPHEVLEVER